MGPGRRIDQIMTFLIILVQNHKRRVKNNWSWSCELISIIKFTKENY